MAPSPGSPFPRQHTEGLATPQAALRTVGAAGPQHHERGRQGPPSRCAHVQARCTRTHAHTLDIHTRACTHSVHAYARAHVCAVGVHWLRLRQAWFLRGWAVWLRGGCGTRPDKYPGASRRGAPCWGWSPCSGSGTVCTQRRRACRLADQGDKNDVLLLRQQPDSGLSGNPVADGPERLWLRPHSGGFLAPGRHLPPPCLTCAERGKPVLIST